MLTLLLLGPRASLGAAATVRTAAASAGESFLYRFDPMSETFVFTYTLSGAGACPRDVVVVPGAGFQDIWFTQPCADSLGRLVYTDTMDFTFQEYTLADGARPLNIVSGGGFVWFTQYGRDSIGRLDPSTGVVAEFTTTVGSCPAGLGYGPDGRIWFTEMMADQVASLVVTSTTDYAVTEYSCSALVGGRPYGIVVVGGSVYLAQSVNDTVSRFTPPNSWVHIQGLVQDIPDGPYELVLDGLGRVWGTERQGNRVSQFEYGTLPVVSPYSLAPEGSLPAGIVADAGNQIWFTQWGAGQLGRLMPSVPVEKEYYLLPLPGLSPTGIAMDGVGALWVLASRPHRVSLPCVLRSWEG